MKRRIRPGTAYPCNTACCSMAELQADLSKEFASSQALKRTTSGCPGTPAIMYSHRSQSTRSFIPEPRSVGETMKEGTPRSRISLPLSRSLCFFLCINKSICYIHTYMHTYMHTYIHTYIPAYICTYIYTYMHACMHACMHTYIHTYIQAHAAAGIHTVHKHTDSCTHTYMHTYTHTYRTCIHAYRHT